MPKPKIYIAGPFFNLAQIDVIDAIEYLCSLHGFPYYSPRKHSGSADIPQEHRKDPKVWSHVIESNKLQLDVCDLIIAVLDYKLPADTEMCQVQWDLSSGHILSDAIVKYAYTVEIPDSGTVWEMGYAFALGKPILGYVSGEKPKALNLMLSHTMRGVVSGTDRLAYFLESYNPVVARPVDELLFDWKAVESHKGDVI